MTVERPIAEVFAYIADGTNNRRWRTGVLEIERTTSEDRARARYRQVVGSRRLLTREGL